MGEFKNLGFDAARHQLIEILSQYCDWEDIKLTIIFDGTIAGKIHIPYPNVKAIFSEKGQSADSIIEKLVADSKKPSEITVATDDSIEQDVVFGFGARYVRAADLKERIDSSKKGMTEHLDTKRRQNWQAGRMLEDL